MPAYIIANIFVNDDDAYDEYRQHVQAGVARYEGRFLVRGGRCERLEGHIEPSRVVVIQFPTYEQAKAWYESPEYGPLIELRQSASEGDLILVDGV